MQQAIYNFCGLSFLSMSKQDFLDRTHQLANKNVVAFQNTGCFTACRHNIVDKVVFIRSHNSGKKFRFAVIYGFRAKCCQSEFVRIGKKVL